VWATYTNPYTRRSYSQLSITTATGEGMKSDQFSSFHPQFRRYLSRGRIKNLKPGDTVLDRGRRFTIRRIIIHPVTGMIDIIDTEGIRHGPYHPDEFIGIEKRATGIRSSTARFAQLLRHAQSWDRRHASMCHAQQSWLLESFIFGDAVCQFVAPERQREWNVARPIDGHLFTKCGG
jgi:hypothetical protein